MQKQILHVDVNNAFLSWTAIEMLKQGYNKDIREVPSVIGGDESKRSGIVLAKSPKAKIFGITTGETLYQARMKCPNLEVYPMNYKLYKQSSEKAENILSDKDIMDIIELVLTNQAKEHNVNLKTKIALKANSYINGHINDTIFTLCEYAKELIQLHDINTNLEIVLTEDENNWYFKVKSEYVNKMSISQIYLIKKVALSLENVKFYQNDNEAVFEIKKVIV